MTASKPTKQPTKFLVLYKEIKGDGVATMLADRYFNEILASGLVPTDIIYTDLIYGHFNEENITEAFSAFTCMIAIGIVPDIKTYSVVIIGLLKNGKMQEALRIFYI